MKKNIDSGKRKVLVGFVKAISLAPISYLLQACKSTNESSAKYIGDIHDYGVADLEEFDCIVLGAGLSGMTAANALVYPTKENHSINNKGRKVLVIEGRNRIGGRLHTISPEGFGGNVELGGQYIHVDDKVFESLSLWKAIKSQKIEFTPINRLLHGVAFSRFFKKLRSHIGLVFELPFLKLISFSGDIEKYSGPDISARTWVNTKYEDHRIKAIADIYLSGPAGTELSRLSLNGFNYDRFSSLDSGNYEYKINNGWKNFIEYLGRLPRKFPNNGSYPSKVDIKFNSQVKKIEYRQGRVLVTVQQQFYGQESSSKTLRSRSLEVQYLAKTAIVTFPIGILRRSALLNQLPLKYPLEFSPELPEMKKEALSMIGVGIAAKMFIAFDENFWGDDTAIINRLDGKSKMGRTYFISNYGDSANNYVLGAFMAGGEARKIKDWNEKDILRVICDELAEMYPEVHTKKPIHMRIRVNNGTPLVVYKHWANDDFAYGNDSFLEFGKENDKLRLEFARRELANPKETPGLFWAGEATAYSDGNLEYDPAHAGFTHGAHTSGIRAAKEVSKELDKV